MLHEFISWARAESWGQLNGARNPPEEQRTRNRLENRQSEEGPTKTLKRAERALANASHNA